MASTMQAIVHVDHRSTYAHLSKAEFPYTRMHREEVPLDKPSAIKGPYESVNKGEYPPHPKQVVDEPLFTLGCKNALGTSEIKSRVTLSQLRAGQVKLAGPDTENSWSTTSGSQFIQPDMNDPLQGRSAPRLGQPARMPYSEVDRNFGQIDSTGTLPGGRGFGGKFNTRSEHQSNFGAPGVQPRQQPEFTLRCSNDLGTGSVPTVVSSTMLNSTHFEFGTYDGPLYDTSTASKFSRPGIPNPRPKAGVGSNHDLGPAVVERGFRENTNSADYNLITNRQRLGGEHNNTEAFKSSRATIGHRQFPTVDPRVRGPTGGRQAYDIITGVDRPKEQWGTGIAPPRDMGSYDRRPEANPHLAAAVPFKHPPPRCECLGSMSATRPY